MQYTHDWSCRPGLEGIQRSDPGPEPLAGPAAPLEGPQGFQNHLHMTHVSGSSVGSAPVAALGTGCGKLPAALQATSHGWSFQSPSLQA